MQMGANVLVEFENVFFNWGHIIFPIGGNPRKCVSEFEFVFFNGGYFFPIWANVKKWNLKMFFFNWGHFFYNWGQMC